MTPRASLPAAPRSTRSPRRTPRSPTSRESPTSAKPRPRCASSSPRAAPEGTSFPAIAIADSLRRMSDEGSLPNDATASIDFAGTEPPPRSHARPSRGIQPTPHTRDRPDPTGESILSFTKSYVWAILLTPCFVYNRCSRGPTCWYPRNWRTPSSTASR